MELDLLPRRARANCWIDRVHYQAAGGFPVRARRRPVDQSRCRHRPVLLPALHNTARASAPLRLPSCPRRSGQFLFLSAIFQLLNAENRSSPRTCLPCIHHTSPLRLPDAQIRLKLTFKVCPPPQRTIRNRWFIVHLKKLNYI